MKIYIETYGCAANQADSDMMKELLKEHEFVSEQKADVIIVNTCGVKGSTENKIVDRLKKLKGKKVVVAGCLPKIIEKKLRKEFPGFSFIGPDQVTDIEEIIVDVNKGKQIIRLSGKPGQLVCLHNPKKIQPIMICKGCLGACAYCAAKNARGHLYSFPAEDIVRAVKCAVDNGAETILITAQDTGTYGLDIGTNIPALLKEVIEIPGEFKIRVGMMNPTYAIKFLNELIEVYKNSKIIKFIHVPVQAGSDSVLKLMNRRYKVADFKKIVKEFRKAIPEITISTDIICGFPGETEEDFQKTIELIKEVKPEVINISKFYLRPGTKAAEMKQLNSSVIKERSRKISALMKDIRRLNKQRAV